MPAFKLFFLLLVVCIGLIAVQPARAASDTQTATIATGTGWTNLSDTVLASASGSEATSPNNTNKATLSSFGFGMSAAAQIDGIKVDVIGNSTFNNKTADYQVEISGDNGTTWKSPNSGGATRQFTDNSPPQSHTLGGISDDWGWSSEGWNGDNCSDSNFQLRIWNLNTGERDPKFEQIQVTVYYTVPSFTQASFRGRNDDAGEVAPPTGASWKVAADTNWTQTVDENFRVRFVVQETIGVSAADKSFQLEYNRNGGGWNDVSGASSVVRAWASPNVADGADTTQQVGSGSFVTPNAGFDEVNGLAGGTSLDFSGSDEVEVAYCVQIRSADVSATDTIQLRVKGLDSYTNTPTITATASTPPAYDQDAFRARNDNGNETAATWKVAADTNWTQTVDENFRVRFVVQETIGVSAADKSFQLEYNLNGGGWNDINAASSVVRAWASPNVADGADTTQQVGSGTFVTPNAGFDEVNGLAGGTSLDFSGSDEVEVEYSVQIRSVDVANDDTIQLRVKSLDSYTTTPTVTVSGIPEFDQDSFRGRSDDGNETTATWKASANVNWDQLMDDNFRVRFVVQETAGGSAADKTLQLEYNLNGGGWNDVSGASSVVRAWASPNVADGADTTQQVGSGSFVTPNAGFDEVNGLAGGTSLDFSGSDEVEVAYCVQVRSADVSATDTIQLRVKGLDSYTNTPTITATASTPPAYDQDAFRARNDNGNETAATWKVAADTNWTQTVDENFRVRFVVQETLGAGAADKTFQLEYNRNGGGWNDVTAASSVVRAWASPNVSDGADTTQQEGSGTFITPNAGFDEADGQVGGTSLDFSGSDEVELEFSLQLRSVDLANGDTIQLRVKGVQTYTETPTATVTGILEFVQDSFRGRNNDGSETTATWQAAANVNWTQAVEGERFAENFRVRFLVRENGGVSAADKTFQLEYKLNAGSWTDVTGSSTVVKAVDSDNLTDGGDTTQQLGSGTFITPNAGIDEVNGQAGGSVLDFAGSDEVELEFSLRILGEDVLNNDSIQLRIKGLDTYTNTPTITVLDCTFHRYRKITIQSSKVAADVTDFPVMIKITGTDFQGIEDDVTDADGDDIIFRASLTGDQLDHEFEVYDTTNDIMVAWVKVPNVSSSSNTDIYMYYGNACISSSTQDAPGVWSNGYEAVYHLHDDYLNSEGTSARNGTNNGAVHTSGYTGQIAEAADFEYTDPDNVAIGDWTVSGNEITIQAWMKWDSRPANATLLDKSNGSGYVWNLSKIQTGVHHRLRGFIKTGDGTVEIGGSTDLDAGTWYFVVLKYDGNTGVQRMDLRLNNNPYSNVSQTGDLDTTSSINIKIGDNANGDDDPFDGVIDEVRISSTARSDAWLNTEYNNQFDPATFFTLGPETPATVIKLISFYARGEGEAVRIEWETAQEHDNMGFYLYRAPAPGGPYQRLNQRLIPGRSFSGVGQAYSYMDTSAVAGQLYYYRLEDLDTHGKRTVHGPVCVDWDADGMPDDWELTYGFDPTVDDSMLDADGDGLSNLEEYQRGTDPTNADSDGDGILDGDEVFDDSQYGATHQVSPGVEILAQDPSGITLELRTEAFEAKSVEADGQQFERLRILDYIHGATGQVGYPELPLKGILVDVPEGRAASLTVLRTVTQLHDGYRVYPVPQRFADGQSDATSVGERFVQDQAAYSLDGFYPEQVAQTGGSYLLRGQQKQQVLFYPVSFNPVTGQIRQHSRIRVRLDFVDTQLAQAGSAGPVPWKPPLDKKTFDSLPSMGVMAGIFTAPPAFVSPLLSALSSLGSTLMAAWTPPISETSGHKAYKVSLSEEGIYRIDQTQLTNNGIDPAGFDLAALRMYHLGEEVAVNVHDADADDRFDAADYIEFYGAQVTAAYAKYSAETVYWLTTGGGAGQPRRMGTIDGTPAFGPVAGTHGFTQRYELDQTYLQAAPGPDSRDRWVFSAIARGSEINHAQAGLPVNFTLTLADVGDSAEDTLTISMIGAYDTDHEVDVELNGSYVGTYYWSGLGFYDALIEGVDFVDGDNTVSVTCVTGLDKIAFDWFEAGYQRYFKAVNNYLEFNHATGYAYQVEQFATDTLTAFDVTDAFNVQQVTNFTVSGSNPYTLAFESPPGAGTEHTYIAMATGLVKTPTAISEDVPSDLADTANGADYILITHQELGWDGGGQALGWLDDLVALRQSQGLRVKVARITDIFDEFSYGVVTPAAIRDFLAYAYGNWTPAAPQYVLLVGDASYDYKNNWNLATTVNHVPSYLTYTQHLGETVTDEWFVRISGEDAAADMYIGRLPAVDAAQAAVMVDKILAYEAAGSSKLWGKDILLVADNQAEDWESVFETMNEDAAALVPGDMNIPSRGYLQDYEDQGFGVSDLTVDLTAAINSGALMVNYSGHGALGLWADEAIFDNSNGWPRYRHDVDELSNDGLYPLFVSMSCLTGYFAYPEAWSQMYNYNYFSLGESLLRAANAGAAAAFMPTGMTSTDGQHILSTALFASLFTEDIRQLGPAIANAKLTLLANGGAYNEEVSATFLLLGDPAMKLKVPLPERPAGLTAAQTDPSVVTLNWQPAADADGNAVAGYHVYRSVSASGGYSGINAQLVTGTRFEDHSVAAGTRYYYTVTSVDGSVYEDQSVMSQAVSIVPSAPVTSLAGSSGGGGGGGGCFISTTEKSFSLDQKRDLVLFAIIVFVGLLLLRRKVLHWYIIENHKNPC